MKAKRRFTIDTSQADAIRKSQTAAILKRLAAGKTITAAQQAFLDAQTEKPKRKQPDAQLYSVNALSKATGRDRRTVDKAIAHLKPAKTVNGRKFYRLEDVQAVLEGRGSDYAELRAEQIRQQTRESKERADLLAMERSQLAGTLVPMDEVQQMYSVALLAVRQALLAMPSECASRTNPTDPLFAQAALQTWVDSRALPMIREQLPKPAQETKAKQ